MIVLEDVTKAAGEVRRWLAGRKPEVAIVLGSGLSGLVDRFSDAISLPYHELSGFPASGVTGHIGRLHCGKLFGREVLAFQGRYHFYEGYNAWQVTALVRLAAALGCQKLLLTNAAGGIEAAMQPGDFMLVTDHLNFTGMNPLYGRPEREFIDLCQLYRCDFSAQLQTALVEVGVRLHTGVLAWMPGPSYETPAEIRALEILGASAVSMSTIPEAIVARLYRMETVAVSCISNLAAGKTGATLDHQDVLSSGERSATALARLTKAIFSCWF